MTTAGAEKIGDILEQAARTYLEDRAYDALLTQSEPMKTKDIVNAVGTKAVTLRLIKEVLGSGERFEQAERKWTLADRVEDTQRTMQRILSFVLDSCGRPMTVTQIAREVAAIFDRPIESFESTLPRTLQNREHYFSTSDGRFGRAEWLIVANSESEDDVLFDSFLSAEDVALFADQASKAKWPQDNLVQGAADFAKKLKRPVPCKVVQFYAWKADPIGFDPDEFYSALASSEEVLLLSGQMVVDAGMKAEFETRLGAFAKQLEEMPGGEEEEAEGPVVVTEAELEEIVGMITSAKGPAHAEDILDAVLEVAPGEKAYEGAFQSLVDTLANDERVVWVGDGRWRTPDQIPDTINDIPKSLGIPAYSFVTPEGEELDQELEDDGLDSGLRSDILDPIVMSIGDEDPVDAKHTQKLGKSQRCVLNYQHKEAGIFPLCQINPAFFGAEPGIINITLIDEAVRREVWMNNETHIIYDMKEWYSTEMPVSGAVFQIEKTQKADEFRFVYTGETDDKLFIQPGRLLELLELKEKAESQDMPTTDIILTIMERYKQGIEFAALFTEVNLVRRCTRRLVASILSSYHAFYRKEMVWRYDSEKWTKGFNKAKRKYIKK